MSGFNLPTKALFSFHLGGFERWKLRNLWPDKAELQSAMIWLKASFGLVWFVVLAPEAWRGAKQLCVPLCVYLGTCVLCILIVSAPRFPLSI